MTQFISGTFYDAAAANKAVEAIIALDYPRDRINVILSNDTRRRFWNTMPGESRREDAPVAAVPGGVDGDTIGEILHGGTSGAKERNLAGVDPPAVLRGPIALALVAEGDVRAQPDSVLRALVRLGRPRSDAERLKKDVDSGGIVVGVSASNGDRTNIERALRTNAARNVMESLTAR